MIRSLATGALAGRGCCSAATGLTRWWEAQQDAGELLLTADDDNFVFDLRNILRF